ncbi:hypothetical protein B0H11DRAFT_1933508 [Mycena galericulata]|nr:hypothetical protein B0H11DRAFT_1933508 [Mycena galericulata]
MNYGGGMKVTLKDLLSSIWVKTCHIKIDAWNRRRCHGPGAPNFEPAYLSPQRGSPHGTDWSSPRPAPMSFLASDIAFLAAGASEDGKHSDSPSHQFQIAVRTDGVGTNARAEDFMTAITDGMDSFPARKNNTACTESDVKIDHASYQPVWVQLVGVISWGSDGRYRGNGKIRQGHLRGNGQRLIAEMLTVQTAEEGDVMWRRSEVQDVLYQQVDVVSLEDFECGWSDREEPIFVSANSEGTRALGGTSDRYRGSMHREYSNEFFGKGPNYESEPTREPRYIKGLQHRTRYPPKIVAEARADRMKILTQWAFFV